MMVVNNPFFDKAGYFLGVPRGMGGVGPLDATFKNHVIFLMWGQVFFLLGRIIRGSPPKCTCCMLFAVNNGDIYQNQLISRIFSNNNMLICFTPFATAMLFVEASKNRTVRWIACQTRPQLTSESGRRFTGWKLKRLPITIEFQRTNQIVSMLIQDKKWDEEFISGTL